MKRKIAPTLTILFFALTLLAVGLQTYFNVDQQPALLGSEIASDRVWVWIIGAVGILGSLVTGWFWAEAVTPQPDLPPRRITLTNLNRFLLSKLLFWLPITPIPIVILLASQSLPIFVGLWVGFIGGYGLLSVVLYRLGKMPGTQGDLPFYVAPLLPTDPAVERVFPTQPEILKTSGLGIAFLIVVTLYCYTGLNQVLPMGDRLIWLFLFTPITTLGFWIGLREGELLESVAPGSKWRGVVLSLTGLAPFFLYAAGLGILGSTSDLIAALIGLTILLAVLGFGKILYRVGRHAWLTAMWQAVALYWIVLATGPLFSR